MNENFNQLQDDPVAAVRDMATRVLPIEPEQIDAAVDQVRQVDSRIRTFARENPVTTVAIAVGVGFLIGRVLRG